MRIGRIEEDFKEYCKKIDEKKSWKNLALPITLEECLPGHVANWELLGRYIFNSLTEEEKEKYGYVNKKFVDKKKKQKLLNKIFDGHEDGFGALMEERINEKERTK